MSWLPMWVRNSSGPAWGRRSTNFAAASKSPTTASRSRSARAAAGPPPRAAACHSGPSRVADHIAQRTDSALTPGSQRHASPSRAPRAAATPAAMLAATRRAGFASGPSSTRAPGWARATASSSSLVRPPPFSSSMRRMARRSRRSATASAPPTGEVSASTATWGSSCLDVTASELEHHLEQGEQWSHRHLVADRQVGRAARDRNPRGHQHPSQRRRPPLATDDHGHLGPGHPVAQVGLTQLRSDEPGLLAHRTQQAHVDLAPRPPGCGEPLGAPSQGADLGSDPAGRVVDGLRQPVCRGQHQRGALAQRGPPVGEVARVGAAEGLHRAVRVAEQDDVDARTHHGAQQPGRGGRELLGVVDDDQAQAGPEPVEGVRVLLEEVGGGPEDPGRVVGAWRRQGGDLVVLGQHVGRCHPLGPVVGAPEVSQVVGLEAVLDRAHQQVAQLVAEASGGQREVQPVRPGRSGALGRMPGEQLAQDDVLLGAAQQARRRVAPQGRRLAQDAEAERLEGPGERLGRACAPAAR